MRDVAGWLAGLCVSLAVVSPLGWKQAAAGHSAPASVATLVARTLRVYTAPDADQGVAVDRTHFYPVDNSVIAKYDIATGTQVARWVGPSSGLIRHLNSCLADAGRLWCANSNYPQTPMASSIEAFDTAALDHVMSHSLGLVDEGSITWFDSGVKLSSRSDRPTAGSR